MSTVSNSTALEGQVLEVLTGKADGSSITVSSGTYTVPIRNADGMYLDNTDNELYVIVRYAGDPTPIDDITLTFS